MLTKRARTALFFCGLLLLAPDAIAQQAGVSQTEAAYWAVHEAEAPVRGLVHLWLRLAGTLWIVAEWIAAIYLVKGFNALRCHLERSVAS